MTNSNPKINNQLKRVKRPSQGWHRADIKAAAEKLGTSLGRIGLEAGYGHRSAPRALDIWWPAMERIIADRLGAKPWDIWPDRYNDYGQPVQQGNPNKVKVTSPGRPRNVNLRTAN